MPKALRINPNYFGIYDNLGNIFREIGHLDKSISFFKKGLEVSPDNSSLHANLGMTYLKKGWPLFEWRLEIKGKYGEKELSKWKGENLNKKTILILGASGRVGSDLANYLSIKNKVVAVYRRKKNKIFFTGL